MSFFVWQSLGEPAQENLQTRYDTIRYDRRV